MDDGAYASVFYGLTGLHGLHVLAGLLLLLVVLGKLLGGSFDRDANPHVLFTAALWYWHFVDLVWIGLYLVVYLWGNAAGAEVLPETPTGIGTEVLPETPTGIGTEVASAPQVRLSKRLSKLPY